MEMTSLLKDATFYKDKMFNAATDILSSKKLMHALKTGFAGDCSSYSKALLFVAMGDGVGTVLEHLKNEGVIAADIVVIPHPSGANNGRIAIFLGSKPVESGNESIHIHNLVLQARATISRLTD